MTKQISSPLIRLVLGIALCGALVMVGMRIFMPTYVNPISRAQTKVDLFPFPPPQDDQLRIRNWNWTQEKWAKSDAPYIRIRREVIARLGATQNKSQVMESYGLAAKANPSNPEAQFRWGWSVLLAATPQIDSWKFLNRLRVVDAALDRATSPRCYEYSRLRFMFRAGNSPDSRLKDLGLRLLSRDPNDYNVKSEMMRVLTNDWNDKDHQLGLTYARDIVKEKPENPKSYLLLGFAHKRIFEKHHRRRDADAALAAYQKFLQLAPESEFKQGIETSVGSLRQKRQKAHN